MACPNEGSPTVPVVLVYTLNRARRTVPVDEGVKPAAGTTGRSVNVDHINTWETLGTVCAYALAAKIRKATARKSLAAGYNSKLRSEGILKLRHSSEAGPAAEERANVSSGEKPANHDHVSIPLLSLAIALELLIEFVDMLLACSPIFVSSVLLITTRRSAPPLHFPAHRALWKICD